MATRVDMEGIFLSRADIESDITLISTAEVLCQTNIETLKKSAANKHFNNLKEFNELIFIIEIIAIIQNKYNLQNLQHIYQQNAEADIAMRLQILLSQLNKYEEANNVRMYNETKIALQKLMLQEYESTLAKLKELKVFLDEKILECNFQIKKLDQLVSETKNSAKDAFHQSMINIEKYPEINIIKLADDIVNYNVKDLVTRIESEIADDILKDNMTYEEFTEKFDITINDYMNQVPIPNREKYSSEEIHSALEEASQRFKEGVYAELSSRGFRKYLEQKNNYVKERDNLIGLRDVLQEKSKLASETIKEFLNEKSISKITESTTETIEKLSHTIDTAKEIANSLLKFAENQFPAEFKNIDNEPMQVNFELDSEEEFDVDQIAEDVEDVKLDEVVGSSQVFNMDEEEVFNDQDNIDVQNIDDSSNINESEKNNIANVVSDTKPKESFQASQIQGLLFNKDAASILKREKEAKKQTATSESTINKSKSEESKPNIPNEIQPPTEAKSDDYTPRGPKR